MAGESAAGTVSQVNGDGQECPLYTYRFAVECIDSHPFRRERGKDGAPSASVDDQKGGLGQGPRARLFSTPS